MKYFFNAYALVNSSCTVSPPRPPPPTSGNCGAFARLVSPKGGRSQSGEDRALAKAEEYNLSGSSRFALAAGNLPPIRKKRQILGVSPGGGGVAQLE